MKIKETYISHTGLVNVGNFALFIDVQKDGVNVDNDELVKQSTFFPRIVLLGEPFEQREDVTKFCKKIIKQNEKIKIEIHTKGLIKPLSIPSIDNINFNVHLQLKISGLDYKQRIKSNVINWYNQVGANFLFIINIEDELDEANLIIQENNISKRDVYLVVEDSEQLEQVRIWAKLNGYNFAPNFRKFLWKKDGRN